MPGGESRIQISLHRAAKAPKAGQKLTQNIFLLILAPQQACIASLICFPPLLKGQCMGSEDLGS